MIDLKQGLSECGIEKEKIDLLAEKMESYINEIILFNSAYNLTNTSDHDELAVRHILDSLSTYPFIKSIAGGKQDFIIGDIGSGGGLPGIPLAAAFPEHEFVLVERMSRRCAFLENCAAMLGLKNVIVQNCEAEKVENQKMSLTVFRAFRPLDEQMTKTLLALTKKDGYLFAYKAKLENIKEEMGKIKEIVPSFEIQKLTVPFLSDAERNLVIIKNSECTFWS
ncbi:MAG: 16S rRNA (guanine(527)-N(7))-methyltransferase RsmG [Treponema sp.]|nr:16S rRNA (guanine(527)-N(7))-methyltransferase RsmG [Treponema sp.]